MAASAATKARRSGANAGSRSCGAVIKMHVNATSAPNARPPRPVGAGTASAVAASGAGRGRHHSIELLCCMRKTLRILHAAHPDRTVEDLHVVETVRAKPPEHFGIEVLPLILRREPV